MRHPTRPPTLSFYRWMCPTPSDPWNNLFHLFCCPCTGHPHMQPFPSATVLRGGGRWHCPFFFFFIPTLPQTSHRHRSDSGANGTERSPPSQNFDEAIDRAPLLMKQITIAAVLCKVHIRSLQTYSIPAYLVRCSSTIFSQWKHPEWHYNEIHKSAALWG